MNKREKKLCRIRIDLGNSVTPQNIIIFINIHIIGVPDEEIDKVEQNLFEGIKSLSLPYSG